MVWLDASQIRLQNLKILLSESNNSLKELARRVKGKESKSFASYLSALINEIPTPDRKKPRTIGNELARNLEIGCGKERGWLDHIHDEDESKDGIKRLEMVNTLALAKAMDFLEAHLPNLASKGTSIHKAEALAILHDFYIEDMDFNETIMLKMLDRLGQQVAEKK